MNYRKHGRVMLPVNLVIIAVLAGIKTAISSVVKARGSIALFIVCTFCHSAVFAMDDAVSGVWKHVSKPALIEFRLEHGKAFVKYHDDNPNADGLTLIKDIAAVASEQSTWGGLMYNGYIEAYVPVTIRLLESDELIVYDDANKEVLRLNRI